ncbi:MAG: histidine kinase [Acidobacteria bacterium]|nr:histidine kinase [Acidobacteriota bacterium]
MPSRTGPILGLGFGTLLALIALLGLGSYRRANQIHLEILSAQEGYLRSESALHRTRSSIHLSAILIRDFLLDPSHLTADLHRRELAQLRSAMQKDLTELERLADPAERALLRQLDAELDALWESWKPIFEWTPQQKLALSALFLRKQVLPRRQAVLNMADEAGQLIEASLRTHQREIERSRQSSWRYQVRMLAAALALGLLVAGFSVYRISRLELHNRWQRERAEHAEQGLRLLSRRLVKTQEEERKALSRELHDEVGQALTAVRMELGNLTAMREDPRPSFQERVAQTKLLVEGAMQMVRDLAMGLRPSMLDDLGLVPALQWQAREFSRRCGTRVDLDVDGELESLPEAHRTCVYRVVQEALTNCARHAQARNVRVAIHGGVGQLTLMVQDDGVGFEVLERQGTRGLGLVGMQERLQALGGSLEIISQPGKGTLVHATLPVSPEAGS